MITRGIELTVWSSTESDRLSRVVMDQRICVSSNEYVSTSMVNEGPKDGNCINQVQILKPFRKEVLDRN